MTYLIDVHRCTHCRIRHTDIELYFNKDKSLKNNSIKLEWIQNMSQFIKKLDIIEISQLA